jgi:hypothetical protein
MRDHADLQQALAGALAVRDPDRLAVERFAGSGERVRAGLAIYRGNVQANAEKALSAAYPVIGKLVGDEFFGGLSRAYRATVPSRSGDLNAYGDRFAAFLDTFPHVGGLPYLADVARLEWAVHRAHYAADAQALDVARLAAVAEADWPDLRLSFAPGVAILASHWPVASIYAVHQPDREGPVSVDLDAGGEVALVYRARFRVLVRALSASCAAFVDACLEARTLADAVERAAAHDAGWSLQAELARLIADRVVVGFSPPGGHGDGI